MTSTKTPTTSATITSNLCLQPTEGGKPCHRLVAHTPSPRLDPKGRNLKGDDALGHNTYVKTLGFAKPKPRKVTKPKAAPKAAAKVTPKGATVTGEFVVIGGTRYFATTEGGVVSLTPVVTDAPTKSAPKVAAKRRPAAKVTVLPDAKAEGRDLQVTKGRTSRRTRPVSDPTGRAAIANA